jgi:uncharacterized protein (TIGR03083 family)
MDLTDRELIELGLDTVDADVFEVSDGLRARVLGAAGRRIRSAMHPEWSTTSGGGLSPHTAFIKTAAELATLLDTLTRDEWSTMTEVEDASVAELVRHLVGVERYLLGQLGHGPEFSAPRREDHFRVSREATTDLVGLSDAEIASAWWQEVTRLIAVTGELGPQHTVAYHHLAGSVRGLLVVRTFELWTHDEDIRRALNRPANVLDAERLALMSGDLMNVLNLGMALSGATQPGRTARINLMGPGGGSYDVALAPGEIAGLPDITITADMLEFCKVAANRLPADLIDLAVDGDRSLLEPILVGAAAFACD